MRFDPDFHARGRQALEYLAAQPSIRKRVTAEVDSFFMRHPTLLRNGDTEGYIASVIIERFFDERDPCPVEANQPVPRL